MRITGILTASLLAGCAFSQTTPAPAFEAASIKPNTSLDHHSSSHVTNGEVFMRSACQRIGALHRQSFNPCE